MHIYLKKSRVRPWSSRQTAIVDRLRVLVVDDNQNAAEALAAYLTFEGMMCRLAHGGVQAVDVATEWLPDVVIMDISMPGLNGVEATRALRRDLRTGNIIVIAFTALDEDEVLRHLTHSIFDGYCQKGQPPSVLVGLINTFVTKKIFEYADLLNPSHMERIVLAPQPSSKR
jgi:two-component system OmpR family response regulator